MSLKMTVLYSNSNKQQFPTSSLHKGGLANTCTCPQDSITTNFELSTVLMHGLLLNVSSTEKTHILVSIITKQDTQLRSILFAKQLSEPQECPELNMTS